MKRRKERNKTENSHKTLHKRRDRTLRMRVGLNDLVLEIFFVCAQFEREIKKNRETTMEEKHHYSFMFQS